MTDALADSLAVAKDLARRAIETIGSARLGPTDVGTKSNAADYVTVFDRMVEQQVRETIAVRWPDDKVVGEELDDSGGSSGRVWYVDPIDGTTNFVFGLPWSSFSLAMADADGPAVGVVADPWRDEIFTAVRGRGAQINGKPIHCADTEELAGALLLTEWAAYRAWDGMDSMLRTLSDAGCTTRVMGSSALSLASAAAGRASAAVLGGFNTWDVLAAVLIAREAGAVVLGRDGQPAPLVPGKHDNGVMVSSPGIATEVWKAWTS